MGMGYQLFVCEGNLTRDAELKYLQDGNPVLTGTIAINQPYKDKAGNKKEDVLFLEFTLFGKIAESVAEYCLKGKQILLEGKLKEDKWIGKEDGVKHTKIKLRANKVVLLGGGKKDGTAKTPETSPAPEIPPDAEQGNEYPLDENGEAMPNF